MPAPWPRPRAAAWGVRCWPTRTKIAWAVHLHDQGETIAQIVAKTGVPRTSLYRHMPPRPVEPLTADGGQGQQRGAAG